MDVEPTTVVSMDEALGLLTATELTGLLRQRKVSSRELLDHYLGRRDRLDGAINAIVTLDVEAAKQTAGQADERLASDEASPPLLGLPMTIKDALATKGIRSTGGAVELRDHVPEADAEVVARVRQAGAVIFGKTNLPRWSADVQAYNEIFGVTNNPWDLSCGPGGSSGGAAAAVAAGMTGADIGTDIGGSVRLPAHFSGVCGHKPSFGIVPQLGYISHPSYGTNEPDVNVIGPLARSVDDLELLLDVIAGPRDDLSSAWSLELPKARHQHPSDYRVAAHLDDPVSPVGSEIADAMQAACAALEKSGVRVDRTAWPDRLDFGDIHDVGLPLISASTSPGRTDEEFAKMSSVVLDPGDATASMRMRARGTAIFHRDQQLLAERRETNRAKWARFFGDYDVLLAPVAIVAAFEHQHEGGLYTRVLNVGGKERAYSELIVWTSQFGYVGLPATAVPIMISPRGVPIGMQVVGPHLGDRTTLQFARHLEQVMGGYQVPPMAR